MAIHNKKFINLMAFGYNGCLPIETSIVFARKPRVGKLQDVEDVLIFSD